MKITTTELRRLLPNLTWTPDELAARLSTIGHETEANGDNLHVTLTTNRKDCRELSYLAFDLAGIYPELGNNSNLITFTVSAPIPVNLSDVNRLLGTSLTEEQYQGLIRLGFKVDEGAVRPPDFRTDVKDKADIAEEALRLVGFEQVPVTELSKETPPPSSAFDRINNLKLALADAGLNETITYSFSDQGVLELKNPFSAEEPYLRADLTDGLLQTLARNPFLKKIGFFEVGEVFNPDETTALGIVLAGYKNPESITQKLDQLLGINLNWQTVELDRLAKFGVKQGRVITAQTPCEPLNVAKSAASWPSHLPKVQPISKFPPLVRDVTVADNVGDKLAGLVKEIPGLLNCEKIDHYTNPETSQVSETYRLIIQKMTGPFTEADIKIVDTKLAELTPTR